MIGHSFPTLEEKPYIPTMPKNRIFPATVIAVALSGLFQAHGQPPQPVPNQAGGPPAGAGATPVKPAPPTEAETLLDEAISKVKALNSVSAELVEKVAMLDQKFVIKGRYRKASKDRFFLKLEVHDLPDSSGLIQQVCDGTTFWEYQKVFETQIYRKLEAGAILAKLRGIDLDEEMRERITIQLGFAGPDALLVGLRKTITFDQKTKGTLDGRPVWIIRGNWTNHEGLVAPNLQPLPPAMRLPSYVPSLVTVYLGEDDYWPYKVMLVGQQTSPILEDTRPTGPNGKRIGSLRSIQKPLLTRIELIYSDVKLNAPVADQEFVFAPPKDVQADDRTKEILDGLEQAATRQAAMKKAEAAKGEDPLLNQTIDVPKSTAPGEVAPPAAKK
ncbi:LolA family protein [Singulisphaera sp. GP187]|uniref:LolA family protein n=1 Tax=Singulisphaera sp. GP187 TaxID=1882752 RepID=UPI0020B13DF6|nr:hypothetical protein [Singulisphaera sp. GP187]